MPNIIMADAKGEKVFYNNDGMCYTEKMDITVAVNPERVPGYAYCPNLKELYIDSTVVSSVEKESRYQRNTNLEKVAIMPFTKYGHYYFQSCNKLKEAQLGRIGVPVTKVSSLAFSGDTQADLTITIFVADDANLPLENSPFGATNASIIYRSATTGEVISV